MHSVVRILEAGGQAASDGLETARSRMDAVGASTGFVTLLAILGDDRTLVVVEIFETREDLTASQRAAASDEPDTSSRSETEQGRTITGEIILQRGL